MHDIPPIPAKRARGCGERYALHGGLAAVIARGDAETLPAVLCHRLAAPAAGVAVVVELVLDKMPFTGSGSNPQEWPGASCSRAWPELWWRVTGLDLSSQLQ